MTTILIVGFLPIDLFFETVFSHRNGHANIPRCTGHLR